MVTTDITQFHFQKKGTKQQIFSLHLKQRTMPPFTTSIIYLSVYLSIQQQLAQLSNEFLNSKMISLKNNI